MKTSANLVPLAGKGEVVLRSCPGSQAVLGTSLRTGLEKQRKIKTRGEGT